MSKIVAILSMLHEPPGRNSATRRFRDQPVLTWTLQRICAAGLDLPCTILCWEDQSVAAAAAISAAPATVSVIGPRRAIPQLQTLSASRRFADGWRGGLLGACEFDRGFHGDSALAACQQQGGDAVLLIDPSAGLVAPELLAGLIRQADSRPDIDLFFSQAAPGLSGALVRYSLLKDLAAGKTHPGALLNYRPDFGRHDPTSDPACAPVDVPLARTTRRFTLDSDRQCNLISAAAAHLNGALAKISALELLQAVQACDDPSPLPREAVMELTTRRRTAAIFRPAGIQRPDIDLAAASRFFAELAEQDDSRVVFAGCGDPLLHDQFLEILESANRAGINAIALESDFVGIPPDRIAALANSCVDIVCVHLPAAQQATYTALMGVDAMAEVAANIRLFAEKRAARGRGVPLLVPTFVKCRQNIHEMEPWYDYWLRTLQCAVIAGPSDYSGLIADCSAADMTGPRRLPCRSLATRLMVHCDGAVVSCEQDVQGRQKLGATLKQAWTRIAEMRRDHLAGQWDRHPVCSGCKQWMRR